MIYCHFQSFLSCIVLPALPSESGEESQGHPGPVLAELQRLRAENKQLKDQLEKANYRIEHLKHHLGERVDKEYEQSEGKKQ